MAGRSVKIKTISLNHHVQSSHLGKSAVLISSSLIELCHEKTCFLQIYAKTKAQISSCGVTAKLISAFIFAA